MTIDRGYVRETRNGPSVKDQIEALRNAGVRVDGNYAPVYVDRLPEKRAHRPADGAALERRAAVVADVRPGGRLVVARLDRLGVSAGDIRAVMDELFDRGCVVVDVNGGAIYDAETPRTVLSGVTLAAEATLKAERVVKARAVRAERLAAGQKASAGGNRGWHPTKVAEDAARAAWNDLTLTQAQAAAIAGVSPITLRRRFGARGAPRGRRKIQSA